MSKWSISKLDRMSYQRLCGLGQAVNIPDRTTIWTFENRIGEVGANAPFDQVATPADWEPAKRHQKNLETSWAKNHGKFYFGYTLSVNVDNKYKLIRKFQTDMTSTHDSQNFDNIFDADNTSQDVYADRSGPSEAREEQLAQCGVAEPYSAQGKLLSECQQQRNCRIAKVRARVKHVLAMINQMSGKLVRAISKVPQTLL